MSYYDNNYNTGINGAPNYGGGGILSPYGGGGGYAPSTSPQEAANDPFAYTSGSLLTPWSGHFDSGAAAGGGGGAQAPAYTPFNYGDFGYTPPDPGRFDEKYADPAAFRFADFQGPSDFKAPTAEDMKADPGYQARMNAVTQAQRAGAAHGGVLRTGGYEKGLSQAVGNQASQEYQNTYGRMAQEHDRKRQEAESNYGINQGNTKTAFDTNTQNAYQAYGARQNTWAGNANVALQQGNLGYNVAQGTWDRNYAKARQGYDDEQAHNAAVAAAASANANASYGRDLADYERSRDEFWTNQDRQYAILDREANRGYEAANTYANQLSNSYGAQADYMVGGANSRAAGQAAAGQAWGNAYQNMGNTAGGMLMYAALPRMK